MGTAWNVHDITWIWWYRTVGRVWDVMQGGRFSAFFHGNRVCTSSPWPVLYSLRRECLLQWQVKWAIRAVRAIREFLSLFHLWFKCPSAKSWQPKSLRSIPLDLHLWSLLWFKNIQKSSKINVQYQHSQVQAKHHKTSMSQQFVPLPPVATSSSSSKSWRRGREGSLPVPNVSKPVQIWLTTWRHSLHRNKLT